MTDAAATPTDDDRMRAAVDMVGPSPSRASRTMLREHPLRPSLRPAALWGVVVAAVLVVAVLAGRAQRSATPRPTVPTWRVGMQWSLFAVGVVAFLVLGAITVKSGSFLLRRSSPLRLLTAEQRRHLREQVDGDEAIVADQLPLTRFIAGSRRRSVPPVAWWVPTAAILTAADVRSGDGSWWLHVAILVAAPTAAAARFRQQVRRADDFLSLHPTPTPEATP